MLVTVLYEALDIGTNLLATSSKHLWQAIEKNDREEQKMHTKKRKGGKKIIFVCDASCEIPVFYAWPLETSKKCQNNIEPHAHEALIPDKEALEKT